MEQKQRQEHHGAKTKYAELNNKENKVPNSTAKENIVQI